MPNPHPKGNKKGINKTEKISGFVKTDDGYFKKIKIEDDDCKEKSYLTSQEKAETIKETIERKKAIEKSENVSLTKTEIGIALNKKSTYKSNKKRLTIKLLKEAIIECNGNVTKASEKIGISRENHTRYLKNEPKYKIWWDNLQEALLDNAEESLDALIQEKNVNAVIFALKTRGRSRGYGESQTFELTNNLRFDVQRNEDTPTEDIKQIDLPD